MLVGLRIGIVAIPLLSHTLVSQTSPPDATLPAGLPLRVALDHRYPMRTGTQVHGHLTSAVYLIDHIVLPVDTPVYGVVMGCHSVRRSVRVNALLDGDFTPLAEPNIIFERLQLPDGSQLKFSAAAVQRNAVIVRMGKATPPASPVLSRLKTEWNTRRRGAIAQYLSPGKGERIRQYLYNMMPYHPQELWTGEQFDAELNQPLQVPQPADLPPPLPILVFGRVKPTGVIEARLDRNLNSARSPAGSGVNAILSKPLLDPQHQHVLLSEGTVLSGSVVESRPARMFGRNGRLRFSFRKIELAGNGSQVHGILVAAEGNPGDNLTIDSEGGTRATTPNRALSTLTLALLAAASNGDREERGTSISRSAVVSNGFGMMGRIVSMATGDRNVASGFAYYALAKNLCRHWIARGKEVSFPKNTRVQIDLAER